MFITLDTPFGEKVILNSDSIESIEKSDTELYEIIIRTKNRRYEVYGILYDFESKLESKSLLSEEKAQFYPLAASLERTLRSNPDSDHVNEIKTFLDDELQDMTNPELRSIFKRYCQDMIKVITEIGHDKEKTNV